MTTPHSDALVIFGVTGDLAHKMIFPALYAMAKRGTLTVPVLGVALPKWSVERLHERVEDSIKRSGGIDNQRALDHLLSRLSYVNGDYNDEDTFAAIKKALGSAKRPAHYLAIPPALFETVIKGLGASKLAEHARVIVEKPFGRDLASARKLNHVAQTVFPEDSIFRIDHFLGKEAIMNILYYPLRQFFLGADLEPQLRGQRTGNPIRRFRRRRPWCVLRNRRLSARRDPESPLPNRRAACHGAARRSGLWRRPQRESQGLPGHAPADARRFGTRPVYRLPE